MKRFELPTSYDNVVLPNKKFVTKSGRVLCSQHVQDNRSLCGDKNSADWLVVNELHCQFECHECRKMASEY